jgi:AcrR family transcriptional regulator
MRKQPQQERSRATVDAIIEAGIRVLGRNGWSRFTTNHVAEIAGVSIGSVYQYFPDKRALVAAIRARHLDDVLRVVRDVADSDRDIDESVQRLVDGLLHLHGSSPELYRALLDEAPADASARSAHQTFECEYHLCFQRLLARSGSCSSQVAAWVLAAAIEGVIHEAARRGVVAAGSVRREVLQLVRRYLS